MTITDNFSMTRLFITKQVNIIIDDTICTMNLFPIKKMFIDNTWNQVYHLWSTPLEKVQSLFLVPLKNHWQVITEMIFNLGMYKEYRAIANSFEQYLKEVLPEIEINKSQKEIKIKNIIMNEEIWDYVLYILQLSWGEKVTKPLTFTSEEAKQFYLAQKAQEERIAAIRSKNGKHDEDAIAKILLSINYAFPGLTIDYLIDQTLAQIQWLQQYAAGSVSYEVNAKAFAAGNMKKGSKLDFFIK